jgi:hypothetical protein
VNLPRFASRWRDGANVLSKNGDEPAARHPTSSKLGGGRSGHACRSHHSGARRDVELLVKPDQLAGISNRDLWP